jgi:hypothetical protein
MRRGHARGLQRDEARSKLPLFAEEACVARVPGLLLLAGCRRVGRRTANFRVGRAGGVADVQRRAVVTLAWSVRSGRPGRETAGPRRARRSSNVGSELQSGGGGHHRARGVHGGDDLLGGRCRAGFVEQESFHATSTICWERFCARPVQRTVPVDRDVTQARIEPRRGPGRLRGTESKL